MVDKRRNSCKGSPELSFAAVELVVSVKYQQELGGNSDKTGLFQNLIRI